MLNSEKVLVIGTTADYIEMMTERFGARVFFVTDISERMKWKGSSPGPDTEMIIDLEDHGSAAGSIRRYLERRNIKPSGITCFDCESLPLTSIIAKEFNLSFPGLETVINCRSKYLSKKIWEEHGISCPGHRLAREIADVLDFFDTLAGPMVMKPLTGSGSELVMLCADRDDCAKAYGTIIRKLSERRDSRMYTSKNMPAGEEPDKVIMLEEFIPGEEYSCDYIVDRGKARVIRISKKMISPETDIGKVSAYVLPADLPRGWDIGRLEKRLFEASESLGLKRSMAMADMKIYDDEVYLLEITPRPGGDCLPPLIQISCGFDILEGAIDFAEGKEVNVPELNEWKNTVGVHLISNRRGILKRLEAADAGSDKRVMKCYFKRSPGDKIELPPEDYDSRILGYVIFYPHSDTATEKQCENILEKVIIDVE